MEKDIKHLGRNAKLNLCDRCYKVYLSFIEPGIRKLIFTRLNDMRSMESNINQMVMRHKGVFKTDMDIDIIALVEGDDKNHEDVHKELLNKNLFNEIKIHWGFKKKIKYLKNALILPESCYALIDKARERRNLIHESPMLYNFTDEDLGLFSRANNVSANLLLMMRLRASEDVKQRIISNCENSSQRYLEKM